MKLNLQSFDKDFKIKIKNMLMEIQKIYSRSHGGHQERDRNFEIYST